jgi:hypothetical protein
MPCVLRVAAFEIRYPVAKFIAVKANDAARYALWAGRVAVRHRAAKLSDVVHLGLRSKTCDLGDRISDVVQRIEDARQDTSEGPLQMPRRGVHRRSRRGRGRR